MTETDIFLSARQVKAGRALLGLTLGQLASLAGVAASTIEDFESESNEPSERTRRAIKTALESAGIAFANDGAESVSLQRPPDGPPHGVVLH